MNPEHLAEMVNDIAHFFAAEPDREAAVSGVSGHLKKFWDPRMRRQIVAYLRDQDGGELSELARAGVTRLAELDAATEQARRAS
ncbi:MAG TPA: formate dehydrogenase subunit delta [Rudaea sp.]|nr:formate dehydrogenase subunit delta [Rudaea sp.]